MDNREPSPLGLNRTRAKRAKWKAKYLANRAARSLFNSEHRGESKSKGAAAFHSGLESLSRGLGT